MSQPTQAKIVSVKPLADRLEFCDMTGGRFWELDLHLRPLGQPLLSRPHCFVG